MDDVPQTPPAEVRPAEAPAAPEAAEAPRAGNSQGPSEEKPSEVSPPPPPARLRATALVSSRLGPLSDREGELCARAGRPDLLYVGGALVLAGSAVTFDAMYVKHHVASPALRVTSSGFVGLTFGALLGGGMAALPKCRLDVLTRTAPEGAVASPWPLALSTALFAGITSPFFVAIGKGRDPISWEVSERSMHVIIPGITGFAGALLPYIPALAPRNGRAARELQKLQIGAPPQGAGAFATFTTSF